MECKYTEDTRIYGGPSDNIGRKEHDECECMCEELSNEDYIHMYNKRRFGQDVYEVIAEQCKYYENENYNKYDYIFILNKIFKEDNNVRKE